MEGVQNYYMEHKESDLVELLMPLAQLGYYMDVDGKFHVKFTSSTDTPWFHVMVAKNRECKIYQDVFFKQLDLIHSRCLECWKVVVKPRTLEELFMLLDIQKRLDRPSKCGIEKRDYTFGPYGGYFYNNSVEEGRKCYELIRKEISENISPDVPVYLKRACTEFEAKRGDSHMWRLEPGQEEYEKFVQGYIVIEGASGDSEQPKIVQTYVVRSWVRWAFHIGDETYKKYTGGTHLYRPPITYHEEDDNGTQDAAQCHGG